MAIAAGYALKAGALKASTWGTAATVDAANLAFKPTAWSFSPGIDPLPNKSYNADALDDQTTCVGRIHPSGSFTVDLKYEGLDTIIALGFGNATISGADPYLQTIYHKNDMTGIFGTLAWYDGNATWEVDSYKTTSVSFAGSPGNRLSMTVTWEGRSCTPTSGDQLSSLTEDADVDFVKMNNSICDYKIITQGGSLATIEVNNWALTFARSYDDDDRVYTSTDAPYRTEMTAGAFQVTGSMQIPYEALTYMNAAVSAGTKYDLQLKHVLTSVTKEFNIWLPSVTFEDWTADPADKGSVPLNLTLRCDLDQAGATGLANSFPYITIYNSDATAALA